MSNETTPATPLAIAADHVHDAMWTAWNDPNPPREGVELEVTRKVLSDALDVEVMAEALARHDGRDSLSSMGPDLREDYRNEVRAIRTALLGADS